MARTHELEGRTGERILALLCRGDQTTRELAVELGITRNGVREHLARLEASGWIDHRAVRRGVGKPAHQYFLTPEGTARLSRAYLPLLASLLTVVGERHGEAELERVLRGAGRRLGEREPSSAGLRARVKEALEVMRQWGGDARMRRQRGVLTIQSTCCPLRGLVPDHPQVCRAMEAMLSAFIGAGVVESCDKTRFAACRFVVEEDNTG